MRISHYPLLATLVLASIPAIAIAQPTLLTTGLQGTLGSAIGPDGALYVPEGAVGRIDQATGLIVMLNNLSQPLAGLLVGLFAGMSGAGGVILALSAVMGLTGVLITVFRRRRNGVPVVALRPAAGDPDAD